ncbi:MAG: hypothetical protein KDJ67_15835 [Nitratireductor sp.]|nr:hypothetical protein [Nitratireductor sp.]
MPRPEQDEREREARRILQRVERDSETLGASSLARTASNVKDHMAGADAEDGDAIELWGKRIGRGLGLIAVVILVVYLFANYVLR